MNGPIAPYLPLSVKTSGRYLEILSRMIALKYTFVASTAFKCV
jgi:hypothetical protein